jgi:hypothetical protein
MAVTTVLVVGDRFARQLAFDRALSISDLLRRLRDGDWPSGRRVHVGQGLSADQLRQLSRYVDLGACLLTPAGPVPVHADRALTHKRYAGNVMIGSPERDGEDGFTADLLIDDRCELLADHLTGQHIPAVALLEAARQMWTAVTERFYRDGTQPMRFILDSTSARFAQLVFPIAATLRYRLLSRAEDPGGQRFRCRIELGQSGRRAADIEGTYRVISSELGEKHAARHALAGEIARLDRRHNLQRDGVR